MLDYFFVLVEPLLFFFDSLEFLLGLELALLLAFEFGSLLFLSEDFDFLADLVLQTRQQRVHVVLNVVDNLVSFHLLLHCLHC